MAQVRDIVGEAFTRADQLVAAKEAVYTQIAANRRFLRDLDTQGLLSEEQSARVQELYPPKQRSNGDEPEE